MVDQKTVHQLHTIFRTIQIPKKGVRNYSERVNHSVVGEFNRSQTENGGETISNFSASRWLKSERPKYAICPHKLDYCDTCSKVNAQIKANQTTLNRIRQSGSASENEQKHLEDEIGRLTTELAVHKNHAQKSYKYYNDVTKECKEKWSQLLKLQSSELEIAQHNFTLVLSADYQMQKLVPYWGFSPQPGSTYYLQKLSHDIFGIVDHEKQCFMFLMKLLVLRIQIILSLIYNIIFESLVRYHLGSIGYTSFWIIQVVPIKTVISWVG